MTDTGYAYRPTMEAMDKLEHGLRRPAIEKEFCPECDAYPGKPCTDHGQPRSKGRCHKSRMKKAQMRRELDETVMQELDPPEQPEWYRNLVIDHDDPNTTGTLP